MGKYYTISRKYKCICRYCERSFKAAVVMCVTCPRCFSLVITHCACGCGQKVERTCKCLIIKRGVVYVPGHHLKGRSYLEIYGTKVPKCGFQSGENNIAKDPWIRRKISVGVRKSYVNNKRLIELRRSQLTKRNLAGIMTHKKYQNKYGEWFRSRLEVHFSEILHRHKLEYEYEVPILLYDGSCKIVDFKIADILVEVSGFAYDSWRKDFVQKMKKLRRSTDSQILVLTYPENLNKIYAVCDYDVYTGSIYNEQDILNKILFCCIMEGLKDEVSNWKAN